MEKPTKVTTTTVVETDADCPTCGTPCRVVTTTVIETTEGTTEGKSDSMGSGVAVYIPHDPINLNEAMSRITAYEAALSRIAASARPDGTYNLCREACQEIAQKALNGSFD